MKEFAEIVFPIPLDRKFHYRIPPALREKITVGMRVRVDFGHRSQTGYCVGFVSKPEVAKVKDIVRLEDEVPMLDEAMLELTRWIADYYLCSWGEALEAALPGGVRRQTSEKTTVSIGLNIPRDEVEDKIKELEKKSSQQTRILRLLAESDKPFMSVQEMLAMAKLRTASPINSLKRRKLIRTVRQVVEYDPFMTAPVKKTQPFTPTPEQARAIKAIKQSIEQGQPVTWLLLGVTNSGKTEVYLQVIQSLVKQGKQSIILVPEISLTPQTVQRFRERFDRVAVLHSYLTPGQRAAQWHKIRSGEVQIVIGARSAIFAPFKNLRPGR